jgi:hypothetical protein
MSLLIEPSSATIGTPYQVSKGLLRDDLVLTASPEFSGRFS